MGLESSYNLVIGFNPIQLHYVDAISQTRVQDRTYVIVKTASSQELAIVFILWTGGNFANTSRSSLCRVRRHGPVDVLAIVYCGGQSDLKIVS